MVGVKAVEIKSFVERERESRKERNKPYRERGGETKKRKRRGRKVKPITNMDRLVEKVRQIRRELKSE